MNAVEADCTNIEVLVEEYGELMIRAMGLVQKKDPIPEEVSVRMRQLEKMCGGAVHEEYMDRVITDYSDLLRNG